MSMDECGNGYGKSEFGEVVGDINGGRIIVWDGGSAAKKGMLVYISSAFNPLTGTELREIADRMDTCRKGTR